MSKSKVLEALVAIQSELKAPKTESAGRYRYRNIEDINEAVKPLAAKHGCAVVYTDMFSDDGVCISTCSLMGSGDDDNELFEISAHGCAYVNRNPKNMSVEQASGAASSYARKYAACGLFAIDSSENDPDRTQAQPPDPLKASKGRMWQAIKRWSELHGKEPQRTLEGVQKRPDWAESADFFEAVAMEFEQDMNDA